MKTPSNFKCSRCGSCCKISPFLSQNDISAIKTLGYPEEFFLETLNKSRFIKLKNNKCVFLDDNDKVTFCRIYKSRPKICRLYPTEIRDNGDCRPE